MDESTERKPTKETRLTPEKQLDKDATKALKGAIEGLQKALIAEASRIGIGDKITEDDLYQAYQCLIQPTKSQIDLADAQGVVSQALRENQTIEWVAYLMAIILFLVGIGLLIAGAVHQDIGTRVGCLAGGAIVELLIIMPLRFASNSRKHNMALRMLAHVMDRVDDPKKLAPLLKDTFFAVVLGTKLPK